MDRIIKLIPRVLEEQLDVPEHTILVEASAEHEEIIPATYKTVDVTEIPEGWFRYEDGGESFDFIKIANFAEVEEI